MTHPDTAPSRRVAGVRRRPGRGAAIVTAAILTAPAVWVAGCGGGGGGKASPPGSASQPRTTGSASTAATADSERTDVDGEPIGLAAIGADVWVALAGSGTVRGPDGTETAVGEIPLRLVAGPKGLWVSVFGAGELVRVDPRRGRVTARVTIADQPEGLALDGETLWVVDQSAGEAVAVDAATGARRGAVATGMQPRLAATGESAVWVTAYGNGAVTAIERGTRRVAAQREQVCLGPQGIGQAGGAVYVACTDDDAVVVLDADTLAERARFDLPEADAIVTRGDRVYAVGQVGPTVLVIDAGARVETRRLVLGAERRVVDGNVDAVLAGADLVVSHPEAGALWRLPAPR